jgi:hypothetical protein
MITNQIEVISGDHEPPHPFMIVDRFGMQVDLSRVEGDPTPSNRNVAALAHEHGIARARTLVPPKLLGALLEGCLRSLVFRAWPREKAGYRLRCSSE